MIGRILTVNTVSGMAAPEPADELGHLRNSIILAESEALAAQVSADRLVSERIASERAFARDRRVSRVHVRHFSTAQFIVFLSGSDEVLCSAGALINPRQT